MRIAKEYKRLIAGALVAIFGFFPLNMIDGGETKEWFAFYTPWNYCKDSVVDVSYLLDAPAGKHGFMSVNNGHFYFQDGTRARFWGLNIHSDRACFPDRGQAEDIAKRLAQLGCNAVRMHFLDNEAPGGIIDGAYNDSQHFSYSQMEKLDYFMYQLKQNGIYICFDVFGLGARRFKAGDGVPQHDMIKRHSTMSVSFFNNRIIELSKKFAFDFLTHVNPYTGKAYIDEPGIAMVEMTNENTLFLKSLREELPPYYTEEIRDIWEKWLIIKGRDPAGEWHEDGEFLLELQSGYQEEMYKYLRSIGVKVPIGSSNLPYNNLNLAADSRMDFIDIHAYWDLSDNLDRIHNRPLVMQSCLNPSTIINTIAAAKISQKPLISTEWGSNWPNDWRAADILTTASYARLNDWDGLFLYAYNGGWGLSWDNLEKRLYYGTVIFNDPAKMGLFPLASIIFLRGDVAGAANEYKVSYNVNKLFNMEDAYQDKLKTAGIAYVSRSEKDFDRQDTGEINYLCLKELSPENKRIVSDTGELISDTEKGIFILKSPRTFSFSGFINKEIESENSGVSFSTTSDFATFTVTSLDGQEIGRSRHLLAAVVGRARNKGQKFTPHITKKPNDTKRDVYILNKGTAPILIEAIEGDVSIKNNLRKAVKVFVLDESGLRKSQIPVKAEKGSFSFQIQKKYKTMYYEIIKE